MQTFPWIALILTVMLLIGERVYFSYLWRKLRNGEPSNGGDCQGLTRERMKQMLEAHHDKVADTVKGVFYPPLQDLKLKIVDLSGAIYRLNESNLRVALTLDTRLEFDRELRGEIRNLADAVNGLARAQNS